MFLVFLAEIFPNFKQLKNREDSSDFDDSWTVLLATALPIICQIFAIRIFLSRRRKKNRVLDSTKELTLRKIN